jgi:CshA-type fibril repeat protein
MLQKNKFFRKYCLLFMVFFSMNTIGQTTITRQIGQSASDAEENVSTSAMDLESSDLEITYDTGLNRHQIIGMRFNGLNIPQGAYIESAYITFRAIRNSPTAAITRRIHAINVDAQPFFSSSVKLSTLPLTSSFVDWTITDQWLQNQSYNTVDIKNLVQDVVNRPGWFVNSNMAFTIRDLNNTDTANWRAAYAYDGDSSYAPILTVTYSLCSPEIESPIFTLGSSSSRCQGAGSLSYTATSTHSTSISYSLDATSLAAGNTINASTGTVTYVAGWSSTSIITATAFGCKGPKTSIHTVTHIATAAMPSFSSYESNRCSGASSVVYTATAVGAVSYTYSILNTGTGTQPTINSSTGEVSYPANWVGQSTITVTANGCSNTTTASISINTKSVIAVDDLYEEVFSGIPFAFNVLENDLCGFDPSTVSIFSQPSQGILQIGTNGAFEFTSLGSYTGPITFEYQVCNTGSTSCSVATVTLMIQPNINADPCSTVTQEKIFYMPFPENPTQVFASLRSAGNGTSNNSPDARSITSLSVPYPSTIIIYDHWEDGYETNILNPTQSTTQIWGDGILSNGVAPGTTDDRIPAGFYIALDNTFLYNRPTSAIMYDGKDKVFASNEVSVTKVVGSAPSFNVQSYKSNVLDINKFGNAYVLPFGEDTQINSTPVFKYVGLFARAVQNGTIIKIERQNGTLFATSPTLNEGEVWYYAGTASNPGQSSDTNNANDLKAGFIIKSDKKFGVDLVFGDLSNYGTRNIPLYPAEFYGNTYFTPTYSTNTDAPTKAYFVNPNPSPITINWTRGTGPTGSFTVSANGGINVFDLSVATGTKFESVGGESFTAIVTFDDDSSSTTYDWAYTMLPTNRLSDFAKLGWAPGSSDLSANYNPLWVTPTENTTIYVKYNGDVTQGPNQSPCGAYFDVSFTVNTLQSQLIYGTGNDNSGMAVFNCTNTPMAVVWGQRSFGGTPNGAPALDVGYTVDGLCLRQMVFAADDKVTTGVGTPITIAVATNDSGFLVALTPSSVTTTGLLQPANGTIVVNGDGTITYTPNFGFQGTDTFEYRICGTDPNGTYCDTATVTVTVNCDFLADNNIISGLTFMDVNKNQIADADEFKVNPVEIELYQDTNANGILNVGEPLLQTVSSDVNGKYSFAVTTKQTVRDEFNTNAINNNDGTQNWAGDWTSINSSQADLLNASNSVRIQNNYLHVNMSSSSTQYGARRTVNLSNKTKAVLTYDWVKNGFSASGSDWIEVQVSTTATGVFTTVFKFTGPENGSGSHNIDISDFISATTTIRFVEPNVSVSSNTNKWVRFDNIEVKYFNEASYIAKVKDSSVPELERTSPINPAYYAVTFNSIEESYCDYNFGFNSNLNAVNDFNQTTANTPLAGNVLTNDNTISGIDFSITTLAVDLDGDGIFETVLTANGTPQTISGIGTISLNPTTGAYVFIPSTDYQGVVPAIQYTIEDEYGATSSATLQIIVAEVIGNNIYIPIAHNDYGYMTELSPVTINILANDNDVDGNIVPNTVNLLTDSVSSATCVNANSEGDCIEILVAGEGTWSVNQTTGAVTFTPLNTFFDLPSPLQYTVRDNDDNTSNPATIFVNWYSANSNNFFANDDANSGFSGSELTGNVLLNDIDPENDNVVVTGISVYDSLGNLVVATIGTPTPVYGIDPSNPTNYILAGTITLNANGTYIYVSESNYNGTASIIYTACGQSSEPVCDSATLYLMSTKLCSFAPNTEAPEGFTNVGITTLASKRTEWPNDVPNGFIALESKNKGFVITRTTSASIASPVEGMLIYDTTDNCFKLYNGTTWNCIAKTCN